MFSNLDPSAQEVLKSFAQLSREQQRELFAQLKILEARGNFKDEEVTGAMLSQASLPAGVEGRHLLSSEPNLLSFNDQSKGLSAEQRQQLLTETRALCDNDYLVAWGYKSDRTRAGIPNTVIEIRHAFGSEANQSDTCRVGYWFIWNQNNGESLAEIYMLPNRAVNRGALLQMLRQIAPDWFKAEPDIGDDTDGGVRVPAGPLPRDRGPGFEKPIPRPEVESQPLDVRSIGEVPKLVLR